MGGGGLSKLFVEFLVAKKFMEKKGEGGVSIFSVKNFCLKLSKSFVGELLVCLFFGYRKKLCFRGFCHDFPSIFFVSQYWNISQRNPSVLCFRSFPIAKKLWKRSGEGGLSKLSVANFCLTVPKHS